MPSPSLHSGPDLPKILNSTPSVSGFLFIVTVYKYTIDTFLPGNATPWTPPEALPMNLVEFCLPIIWSQICRCANTPRSTTSNEVEEESQKISLQERTEEQFVRTRPLLVINLKCLFQKGLTLFAGILGSIWLGRRISDLEDSL